MMNNSGILGNIYYLTMTVYGPLKRGNLLERKRTNDAVSLKDQNRTLSHIYLAQ